MVTYVVERHLVLADCRERLAPGADSSWVKAGELITIENQESRRNDRLEAKKSLWLLEEENLIVEVGWYRESGMFSVAIQQSPKR